MKKFFNLNKQNIKYYIFVTFFSFFILLIFSKSSPLYFFNDWVDANAFFSVGKGMAHGQIPYKDLFEQKGIILYFIHALAYKFCSTSFLGIYLLESISYSVTSILFFNIVKYYFSRRTALFITCLSPLILLNKDYFRFGDSAEEFSFPFLVGLLYLVVKIANNNESLKNKHYFIQGFLMGIVFWIKYTLIGPWLAFFLFFGIFYLIKGNFQKFFNAVIFSLLGFSLITVPILLYFIVNQALTDMLFVYFKFNMSLYPQLVNHSTNEFVINRFINTLRIFIKLLFSNKLLTLTLMIGSIYLLCSKAIFSSLKYRILWVMIFLFGNFFTFFGGISIRYYLLLDMVILLLNFLSFFVLIKNLALIFHFNKLLKRKRIVFIGVIVSIALMLSFNDTFKDMVFFTNSPKIQIKHKENTNPNAKVPAQIEFSKYLQNKKNVTLLNYKFIDYGFSLKPNIVPNVRYFMKVNIPHKVYPEIINEQNKYIKEKKVDYVVAGAESNINVYHDGGIWLHKNYQVKAIHVQEREGRPLKYVLYEKKS